MPITAWLNWASSQTVSRRRITKISMVRVDRPPNGGLGGDEERVPMLRNQSMSSDHAGHQRGASGPSQADGLAGVDRVCSVFVLAGSWGLRARSV